MGWFRDEQWRCAIEAFDAWFYEATQYVNDGGDRKIRNFYGLTEAAIDAVIDVAHLDPMPVWEIYRLISDRDQYRVHVHRGYPSDGYTVVSMQEIGDKVRLVEMYSYRMLRVGMTDTKPRDARAAELLKQGATFLPAQIAKELGVTSRTLNTYAKGAGVTTPGKGKRDHRYSASERRLILQFAANKGGDAEVAERARTLLKETESKPKAGK